MAEHGIELVDSATLLRRLAAEHPNELREAHHRTVANSLKNEYEVLATLQNIVGAATASVVRAVVRLG